MTLIAPYQCRAARATLGWSQDRLAEASQVAKKTIADFEREATTPHPRTVEAIRATLDAAGVEFIPEDAGKGAGVRRKKPAKGGGQ